MHAVIEKYLFGISHVPSHMWIGVAFHIGHVNMYIKNVNIYFSHLWREVNGVGA